MKYFDSFTILIDLINLSFWFYINMPRFFPLKEVPEYLKLKKKKLVCLLAGTATLVNFMSRKFKYKLLFKKFLLD